MQCFDIITFSYELFSDLLCVCFSTCKDYSIQTRIKINDTLERFITVHMLGHVVLVVDIGRARIGLSNSNFKWLFHVALAYLLDGGWHGSAEKPGALAYGGIL